MKNELNNDAPNDAVEKEPKEEYIKPEIITIQPLETRAGSSGGGPGGGGS
jgi:hypothetical protein